MHTVNLILQGIILFFYCSNRSQNLRNQSAPFPISFRYCKAAEREERFAWHDDNFEFWWRWAGPRKQYRGKIFDHWVTKVISSEHSQFFFLWTFMWTYACSPIWLRYRFQCNALANQRLTNTVAAIRDLVFNTSLLTLKLSIDLKFDDMSFHLLQFSTYGRYVTSNLV